MKVTASKRVGLSVTTLALLTLLSAKSAAAWDGVASGPVYAVSVTGGSNYGFRIFLGGVTTMCTGGSDWAYLNETDSNYKAFVAVLLAAKAQGSPVTIYTNLDNGYCRIGYITVH